MTQARLGNALGRDRDSLAAGDVGNLALTDGPVDRLFDLRARASQKALAVAKALVLRVQPAVYEVEHGAFATVSRLPC